MDGGEGKTLLTVSYLELALSPSSSSSGMGMSGDDPPPPAEVVTVHGFREWALSGHVDLEVRLKQLLTFRHITCALRHRVYFFFKSGVRCEAQHLRRDRDDEEEVDDRLLLLEEPLRRREDR